MALTTSSINGKSIAAETSEIALQRPPFHDGLTKDPLSPFKLVSEDILVNIFSRLEEEPIHLARLACVCRIFAHVVRNVCWKRQCTRIVPEIMPSPQTHLDQIPEPPGGWGALMKLLVCCPGLKHAGVGTTSWDFGLESEIGPSELYNIRPSYTPKRKTAADIGQPPGNGDLTTTAAARDAVVSETGSRDPLIAATGDLPVQSYTLSVRDSSLQSGLQSYTVSRRGSSLGSAFTNVAGRGQTVEKSAVTVKNGNGNGSGSGSGQSSGKDSLATMDAFVQGTGVAKQSSSNGNPCVGPKCLTEGGGGQEQVKEKEKSGALAEGSSWFLWARNSPVRLVTLSRETKAPSSASEDPIAQSTDSELARNATTAGQETLSGEPKEPSASAEKLPVQSGTERSNAPVAVDQNPRAGCLNLGMPAVTVEKNARAAAMGGSVTAGVHCGSGRPPRGKPVKRVRWREEELASKGEKNAGSNNGGSGEHFTEMDRGRSRKRKDRALRRLLAKIPEDPKQRLHIVPAKWTLPREEGSRLLASRFRWDSLYICDWPGCVHAGEKRNYMLFRGFFKNFTTSLLWRNLKDMNARKIDVGCAFCSSTSTWDMMTAFCLRRSFEYHDDGEPVVHACVCENGHVSGGWTDRPGVFAAR